MNFSFLARVHNASAAFPEDDYMDIDNEPDADIRRPLSLLSAARTNPFSLLDPTIGRSIFDTPLDPISQAPFVTHPREVREIPIEVKDGSQSAPQGSHVPTIEDVTGSVHAHGPDKQEAVIIDDDDDDEDTPLARPAYQDEHQYKILADTSLDQSATPSAPRLENLPDYGNDIEEEMIRAAIEASKKEAEETYPNHSFGRQTVCFFVHRFITMSILNNCHA